MKKIFSFLFILLLITACDSVSFRNIDSTQMKELMDGGATVIDVRTKEEYDEGHIVSAINIPLDTIGDIKYDKETVIIVYCASSVRSVEAAQQLIDMGYTNVYNLDGGMLNAGELMEE